MGGTEPAYGVSARLTASCPSSTPLMMVSESMHTGGYLHCTQPLKLSHVLLHMRSGNPKTLTTLAIQANLKFVQLSLLMWQRASILLTAHLEQDQVQLTLQHSKASNAAFGSEGTKQSATQNPAYANTSALDQKHSVNRRCKAMLVSASKATMQYV